MIRLDSTLEKIEITLSAGKTTNDCNYYTSFYDVPRQQIEGYIELPGGNAYGNTNGTTPVTIVAAPNQAVVRNINYISIHNKDIVNTTVSITLNNNGTSYILCKVLLSPDETLVYNADGNGWHYV